MEQKRENSPLNAAQRPNWRCEEEREGWEIAEKRARSESSISTWEEAGAKRWYSPSRYIIGKTARGGRSITIWTG